MVDETQQEQFPIWSCAIYGSSCGAIGCVRHTDEENVEKLGVMKIVSVKGWMHLAIRKVKLLVPLLFIIVFVMEFSAGYYVSHVIGYVHTDAMSRVANAFYVLYSQDPHLGAIGFVWTPLPSLVELLFLLSYPIYPRACFVRPRRNTSCPLYLRRGLQCYSLVRVMSTGYHDGLV